MEKISFFRKAWYKFGLNTLGKFIGNDKPSLHYLLGFVLKKQTAEYYDEVFIRRYLHIEKSVGIINRYFPKPEKEDVILDIGGGTGATASIFAKEFPSVSVLVFEPQDAARKEIMESTSALTNVQVMAKALGNENKKQLLIIGKNSGVSSFLKFTPDYESQHFRDNMESTGEQETEMARLDDLQLAFNKILIMKIDVQGFELEVLKGAAEALKRTILVILEVNNHSYYDHAPKYFEADEYMRSIHFSLFDLLPSTRDHLKLKEWDAIYVNRNFLKD
ncbi:MAG: FkbM family methyltransferase [Bacteroidetes bacterium]|nr:FkbM family methyltransferase [Bacteroidota bacterium]